MPRFARFARSAPSAPSDLEGRSQRTQRTAGLLVALLLVAFNLRFAITSAAALITALTESGALTPATAVLIPAIPTAVFAVAGIAASKLSARVGVERAVSLGTGVLALGLLFRGIPEPWAVVTGTVIGTTGLAVVNILLPAVVRARFPHRIGPVTTGYTTIMTFGAAIAASFAVPLATALGSPSLGLAAWALPAAAAAVIWALVIPRARRGGGVGTSGVGASGVGASGVDASIGDADVDAGAATVVAGAADAATGAVVVPGVGRSASRRRAARKPLPTGTWLLAAFFAVQALLSYIILGWLPTIALDAGLSPERAGVLLGITAVIGVPGTLLVVPLARSSGHMRFGFSAIAAMMLMGVAGFAFAPLALPELWAVFLGFGMSAFPLILVLISGLGSSAVESARASAVIQSIGYTVATLGPLGAGAIRQVTGSWALVLVCIALGAAIQCTLGIILTRVIGPRH